MGQLICVLFDDETAASGAIERLLDSGVGNHVVSAVMHSGELHHEDLPPAADPAGTRSVQGAAIGTAIGAVLGGLLAGPAGVLAVGPLAAALAGGASGGIYGALGGAISGHDDTRPELSELSELLRKGNVLVTVELEGEPGDEEKVVQLLGGPGSRRIAVG